MKHCPNVECSFLRRFDHPAEYRDEIEECSDCGATLQAGSAPEPSTDEDRSAPDELVTVASYATAHEAHMARASLENIGIAGVVQHGHGPFVTQATGVALQVPRSSADHARIALESGTDELPPSDQTEEAWQEEREVDARRRKVGRAAKILVFFAVAFAVLGTLWGGATWSLANRVRQQIASFADAETLSQEQLESLAYEHDLEWLGEGPLTAGRVRQIVRGEAILQFGTYYLLAAIFLALYFWARRSPVPAFIVGLAVYLVLLVSQGIYDPSTIFSGLLIKIILVSVLFVGIQQAMAEQASRDQWDATG